jgi:hypothetical protein
MVQTKCRFVAVYRCLLLYTADTLFADSDLPRTKRLYGPTVSTSLLPL